MNKAYHSCGSVRKTCCSTIYNYNIGAKNIKFSINIDLRGGEAVVQDIENAGGEATFLGVDVAKSTGAKRMIDEAAYITGHALVVDGGAL